MQNTEKKELILITSATGKTGFPATVKLLNDGYNVRILVRSRNAQALELEKLGAEIVVGSLGDYNDLSNALKDVKRVYYCYPFMPRLLESTKTFIKAAKENHIEAVVNMGQWSAEFADSNSAYTNEIRQVYGEYEKSGLNVIQFTPGFFADNMNFITEFAVQFGLMFAPLGNGKCPWISNEDLGLSVAALLENPTPYFGKRLRPTGPKSISAIEMAEIFSKAIGRKVRYVNMPNWMFVKALLFFKKEFNFDNYFISQVPHYFKQHKDNKFDIGGTTNIVKELTGKEPDSFETVVKDWLANSPYKRRNFSNVMAAMKKFMAIPLQSVPTKELKILNHTA